jgi:hypothetical protein
MEWCSLINPSGTGYLKNVFVKKIIQEYKNLFPKAIFACPLSGLIALKDITVRVEILKIMPEGLYTIKYVITDKKQPIVLNITSQILKD